MADGDSMFNYEVEKEFEGRRLKVPILEERRGDYLFSYVIINETFLAELKAVVCRHEPYTEDILNGLRGRGHVYFSTFDFLAAQYQDRYPQFAAALRSFYQCLRK